MATMKNEEIIKTLAAILVLRIKYWSNEAKGFYDEMALGMSIAYENAFEMLVYAAKGDWYALRQFSWSDEAEDLLERVGFDIDFYELEKIIKDTP